MMGYWAIILSRAWRGACIRTGLTSFGAVVIRLFISLALIAGLYLWGSADAARDEFIGHGILIAIVLGAFPIFFVLEFIKAPANFYLENMNIATDLRNQLKLVQSDQRRLTQVQIHTLAEIVKSHVNSSQSVCVVSFGNEECMDFASDFVTAFRLAGLAGTGIDALFSGPPDPTLRDIEILGWANSDRALVKEVSDFLTIESIRHVLNFADALSDEPFPVFVHRPNKSKH